MPKISTSTECYKARQYNYCLVLWPDRVGVARSQTIGQGPEPLMFLPTMVKEGYHILSDCTVGKSRQITAVRDSPRDYIERDTLVYKYTMTVLED